MPIVVEQTVNAMLSNVFEVPVVKSNQNWLQPYVIWGHTLDFDVSINFREWKHSGVSVYFPLHWSYHPIGTLYLLSSVSYHPERAGWQMTAAFSKSPDSKIRCRVTSFILADFSLECSQYLPGGTGLISEVMYEKVCPLPPTPRQGQCILYELSKAKVMLFVRISSQGKLIVVTLLSLWIHI